MASVMLPLFLPAGMTIDKFAARAIGDHSVRPPGLSSPRSSAADCRRFPKGQIEAADAAGTRLLAGARALIVLPQALTLVIPPLVNTFIGHVQGHHARHHHWPHGPASARINAALNDANWRGTSAEAYVVRCGNLFLLLLFHVALIVRCSNANSTKGGDVDRRGPVEERRLSSCAAVDKWLRRLPRPQEY